MRLLRLQFTLRSLMIVVTIICGLLGGALAVQRRVAYCQEMARHYKELVGCGTKFGIPEIDAQTDHDQAMQRLYERIAWRPWEPLPVEKPRPLN